MVKKCLKEKIEKIREEKWNEFKKFGDNCFCPNDFNKKTAEFRRINTLIQLGSNEMDKKCTKKENKCPSKFCAELYEEILREVSKK
jgi:hypothetical protein